MGSLQVLAPSGKTLPGDRARRAAAKLPAKLTRK
jgi:hypothetical protein